MIKKRIDLVCGDCGEKYNKWYHDGKYIGPVNHCCANHYATCDMCGKQDVPCTEPRDHGYLQDKQVNT
jgi:hypothetical protein